MNRTMKFLVLSIIFFAGVLGARAHAYAAPVIFYTDIVSGPNTGGENNNGTYLSIFGKGFGTAKGTSDKVTINGVEVAAYKQWGAPSMVYASHGIQVITVQPGPAVTSGPIVVTVGGVASNGDFTFTVAPGNIYFASLTGNDSTAVIGDISHPWANPQTAIDRSDFDHGAVLVIRGGTWNTIDSKSGAFISFRHSDQGLTNVSVIAYPDEQVIATHKVSYYAGTGQSSGITVADIRFRTSTDGFPFNESPNPRIVNNEVTGMWDTGGGKGAIDGWVSNTKILGNDVHNNGATKLYHGIYISDDGGKHPDGVEIAWNHVHDHTGGRGIQIFHGNSGVAFTNFKIHDNVVHDIALDGILLGNECGTGFQVYNNIVYRTGVPALQVDGSDAGGLRFNDPNLVAEVYNNVLYDDGIDGNQDSGAIRFQNASRITLRDNILFAVNGEKYYSTYIPTAAITSSNNLWYGAGAAPSWESSGINTDPKFVDPTSPARNFHLQSGSPAIDAGVNTLIARDLDGILRPQGSSYDIGAYEYCASNCLVSDTTPPAKPTALAVK